MLLNKASKPTVTPYVQAINPHADLAQDRVQEVIRLSRSREHTEDGIRAGLAAGKSTVDLLGLAPTLEKLGMR